MSYYWKGESYYQLKEYAKARQEYVQFLDLAKIHDLDRKNWYEATALYGAGYTYVKQEKYRDALPYFSQCVTKSRSDKGLKNRILPDAILRSADCSFMGKDYNTALAGYSEMITSKTKGDYALYQKGIILGLQDKADEKIATLEKIESDKGVTK